MTNKSDNYELHHCEKCGTEVDGPSQLRVFGQWTRLCDPCYRVLQSIDFTPPHERVKLVIEFTSIAKLAEFVEDLRNNEVIPKDCAVYESDGLDGTRVNKGTYLLRREGERPEEFRLKVTTKTTREI